MGSHEQDPTDRYAAPTTAVPAAGTEDAESSDEPEVSGHTLDYHSLEQMAQFDHRERMAQADRARRAAGARTSGTRDGGLLNKVLRRRER